jgi:exopolyphosphatase/guanosine-5'-triphosphate,3'-diphosphate pyrophosphatase
MNVSVIDIGTNTVLLLVARFDPSGNITPLVYDQRVPRLGKGVDAQGNLQHESMERVLIVLQEYKTILSRFELAALVVCGTSAVRDAHNREDFARLLRDRVGFELEIVNGPDEALWTYRGAISGTPGVRKATVVDIGGGSTEITVGERQTIVNKVSLNMGSVRLTERCFTHDPPTASEFGTANRIVEEQLGVLHDFEFGDSTLIGVAGTATSLAILDQSLKEFSISAVTNYTLRRERVRGLLNTLRTLPSSRIKELSTVMEGRSDVITAGTLILYQIMSHYRFDEMIVSERGVRYGLAIREWERAIYKIRSGR